MKMTKLAKRLARHIIVRSEPKPAMSIDNVYGFLDALWHKRDIPGPVVEIGCAWGGTTATACKFLQRINCHKPYYCIDTFSGFVEEQLETDHALGLTPDLDHHFTTTSELCFSNNLKRWGISRNVHVIRGDICQIDEERLPIDISVCLLDVDLRDPIYHALSVLKGRMAEGGIILVDDCKADTAWVGANVGYDDFVRQEGLEPKYYMGFGVVEFADRGGSAAPWSFSRTPNSDTPPRFYA